MAPHPFFGRKNVLLISLPTFHRWQLFYFLCTWFLLLPSCEIHAGGISPTFPTCCGIPQQPGPSHLPILAFAKENCSFSLFFGEIRGQELPPQPPAVPKQCFEALTCRDPKPFHKISPSQVIRGLILGCQYLHCWEWEEIPLCQSSWISAELPGNSSLVQGPANPREQTWNGNRNIPLACCFKHLQRCGKDFSLLAMIFFFQNC